MSLVERAVGLVPARARAWYDTPDGRKMTRYAMVSVVAVPVGEMGVLAGLEVLHLTAGWAGVFGNSVAAVPSYYLNRTWVWGKGGRSHWAKEILPFWIITLMGVLLAGWVGHLAGQLATRHHWTGGVRDLLLLGANLFAFGVFWVAKYIFFNKVLFVVKHHHDGQPHTHTEATEAGLAGAAGAPEHS